MKKAETSPWIKTSERPPTRKDADPSFCVLAWSEYSTPPEAWKANYGYVGKHPIQWPYWMPIPPPLPEGGEVRKKVRNFTIDDYSTVRYDGHTIQIQVHWENEGFMVRVSSFKDATWWEYFRKPLPSKEERKPTSSL